MEIGVNPRRVSVTIICVPTWDSKHLATQKIVEILLLEPIFYVAPIHSLCWASSSKTLEHWTSHARWKYPTTSLPNSWTSNWTLLSHVNLLIRNYFFFHLCLQNSVSVSHFLYECSKYPTIKWWMSSVLLKLKVWLCVAGGHFFLFRIPELSLISVVTC